MHAAQRITLGREDYYRRALQTPAQSTKWPSDAVPAGRLQSLEPHSQSAMVAWCGEAPDHRLIANAAASAIEATYGIPVRCAVHSLRGRSQGCTYQKRLVNLPCRRRAHHHFSMLALGTNHEVLYIDITGGRDAWHGTALPSTQPSRKDSEADLPNMSSTIIPLFTITPIQSITHV